jgi:hypothetical protein
MAKYVNVYLRKKFYLSRKSGHEVRTQPSGITLFGNPIATTNDNETITL